jgi:hypothetical protein
LPRPRRTRSFVIAGAVSLLGVLAFPASATSTSGAQLRDPAGDIPIASLDVVSGAIRLDDTGRARTLTMTATMAGNLTGVPSDYDLVTGTRRGNTCYSLATRVRWNGATLEQSYQHTSTFACQGDATPALLTSVATDTARYAVGGDPVDASAGGRTVSVTLDAPTWLRSGSPAGFAVVSHTTAFGVKSYLGPVQVGNDDVASLDHPWTVG